MRTATICAFLIVAQDDPAPLAFHPDKVFEAIPSSMVMNVCHMELARPEWVTKEPQYRNTPWYAKLSFGDAGKPVAFALDEDDETAVLYIDSNRNGDLTDDAPMKHRREIIPEERRTPQLKVWIFDHFDAPVTALYADGSKREINVTFRTYGKVCRDLYNNMKPDIVYWSNYYRSGPVRFGDTPYTVALKDQNADGRYDTLRDKDKGIWGDTIYIDTNKDGSFDRRTEGFDFGKPVEVGGVTYEIDALAPSGDTISFRVSAQKIIPTSLKNGEIAPDFDIPGVGKLSSLRGKVVLVDFWATWCPPCLAEVPNVIKVHDAFKSSGFEVVGVSLDKADDAEKMKQVAHDMGMRWPEVHDTTGQISKAYYVTAIPATFLIGPDGRIIAQNIRGDALGTELEKAVRTLAR